MVHIYLVPGGPLGYILQLQPTSEEFGEGDGTQLQYSCLENPRDMDGGAW